MTIFNIPGKPIPWMRAGRQKNRYYDRQLDKKVYVRTIVQSQMKIKEPISKALKLIIEFHMSVPTSWKKTRRLAVPKTPHKRIPDLDNMVKFICDALNGILWVDDAQIYEIHCKKFYRETAQTLFRVEPYDGNGLDSILEKK